MLNKLNKMRPISNFTEWLSKFRFTRSEMERSYQNFQANNEKRLLFAITLTVTGLILIWTVFNIILDYEFKYTMIRVGLLVICLMALFLRSKWHALLRIFLIAVCYILIYTIIITLDNYTSDGKVQQSFLVGDMAGVGELMFIFTLKNMYWRVATYFGLLVIKTVLFWSNIFTMSTILLIPVKILVFAFLLYNERLDRKNFKNIYDAGEKLKKFEDLLSNDFPSCVAIMNSSFESIIYSNQLFKKKFSETQEPQSPDGRSPQLAYQIFEKLILQDSSFTMDQEQDQSELGVHPSLSQFLQSIIEKHSTPETKEFKTLLTAYKDENTNCYYEVKLRKIIWEGSPSYAIILNDVSDKQMVIGLKMSDEQKDRVIATVSHELRTPINGILGLLEMVSARVQADPITSSYLENCKNCSQLLLHLVNSILDLSQLRNKCLRVSKEWLNLPQLLVEVQSLYIFQAQEKSIDFIIQKDPDIPQSIYTDKYRLTEILVNLLSNAMKFTFKGSVMLKVSKDPKQEDKLIFTVEDTGIGIKEEDKPKLFRMFGKLDQDNKSINTQGVGLGLTISNELVKVLNEKTKVSEEEKLEFDSEFDKGTKFWFRVNVCCPPLSFTPTTVATQFISSPHAHDSVSGELASLLGLEQSHRSLHRVDSKLKSYNKYKYSTNLLTKSTGRESSHMRTPSETLDPSIWNTENESARTAKNVLLVDDNPFNLIAASYILQKQGYNVTKAFNGKECLELLQISNDENHRYQLILTDIQMPVMDGLEMSKEVTRRIEQRELYYVPIVAITAKAMTEADREEFKESGISKVLAKPLVPEEIKATIRELLEI